MDVQQRPVLNDVNLASHVDTLVKSNENMDLTLRNGIHRAADPPAQAGNFEETYCKDPNYRIIGSTRPVQDVTQPRIDSSSIQPIEAAVPLTNVKYPSPFDP